VSEVLILVFLAVKMELAEAIKLLISSGNKSSPNWHIAPTGGDFFFPPKTTRERDRAPSLSEQGGKATGATLAPYITLWQFAPFYVILS
jgi:hypothetical protein